MFLYSLYLIETYSKKDVPYYVKLITLSSWVMNFALIILVPIDIYATLIEDTVAYAQIRRYYYFLYWVLMFYSYILIPIVQQYIY